MEDQPKNKPIAMVSNQNGNVFSLINICKRALIDAGMQQQADEMANRVYDSNSFGEVATKIMSEYCELK
jgi:hypothetical protein